MGIGFLGRDEKTDKTLKTADDVQRFLMTEVNSYNNFEQQLHKEIDDIEKLKKNMEMVLKQFDSLRTLISRRDEVIHTLYVEFQQNAPDTAKCKEYLSMIQTLNNEIGAMLPRIQQLLEGYLVRQTHHMYKESEANQKAMHRMDKDARHLIAETRILSRQFSAHDQDLQGINQKIQQIEQERLS
ncbi:MAG: hypothetical protein ACQESG_03960 [Nanobdellota archaeon]